MCISPWITDDQIGKCKNVYNLKLYPVQTTEDFLS